jgi:hypothetical protein
MFIWQDIMKVEMNVRRNGAKAIQYARAKPLFMQRNLTHIFT